MLELNTLYNMDCLDGMRQMVECGQKIDMVLTDPPYNVNIEFVRKEGGEILNDNLSDKEFKALLHQYFSLCYKLLKDDSFLITFMSWKTSHHFRECLEAAGFTIVASPIWYKNNFGMGHYMRYQYEPMYLAIKGKPELPTAAISDVVPANKVQDPIHSCEKPLNLISKLLNAFTKAGDVVLDGFSGSCSVPLACERGGRKWIAFELDKPCYEMGKERIEISRRQVSMFDLIGKEGTNYEM